MKTKRGYIFYLIFIICLVYVTDELASNICFQMKTEIANDLFAKFGNTSVGKLELLGLVSYPFMAISLFYKTLSDKYGRKPFLIINTFGMTLGMFIIFLSYNIVTYAIGYCIICFFVPHDMQVVYIMESAPAKHRGKIYSTIKCISTLGVMLIPFLRNELMTDSSKWRQVFLIPAIIGLVSSFCALCFAKETDSFIESKKKLTQMSEEEKNKDKDANASGGFIASFKYSIHNPQLRRLYILMAFFNLGYIITMNYQVMVSYGYAQNLVSDNLADSIENALEVVSTNQVTSALFLFPIGSAFVQLIQGFLSDKLGRKPASIIMASTTPVSFLLFTLGSRYGMSPSLVGLFTGACVGSFWAFGDINVMMMTESAPTNLRSSVLSSCYVLAVLGTFTGMGILIPLMNNLGNAITFIASLCISVPGFILAILILLKTEETKGAVL